MSLSIVRRLGLVVAGVVSLALGTTSAEADVTRQQCVDGYQKAQILRRETKLLQAREALLVCSQKLCPKATINDCTPWLEQVEREIPSISVAVRDATGSDVVATVFLDQKPESPSKAGQPMELDPGSHHLRAETNNGLRAELDIVARAGEKNRLVTLVVTAPEKAVVPPTDVTAGRPPTHARSLALPLVTSAVFAGAMVGAVVLGLSAKNQADDLRASCGPVCPDSSLDPVNRNLLLSDISLGLGVVALAVSAYLWIDLASHRASAETVARTVRSVSIDRGAIRF